MQLGESNLHLADDFMPKLCVVQESLLVLQTVCFLGILTCFVQGYGEKC